MPDHHRGSADTLTDVLADAGAICGNGVLVNEYGQTSLPGISALGDCAWHPNRYAASELTRLESVQNATDQAKTVASDIVGNPSPYAAVPWFSSDQYDAKLKTAGWRPTTTSWSGRAMTRDHSPWSAFRQDR